MSSKANFYVLYDGPALANHEMDVRDLAPALLALSDVLEGANEVLNGDRASISVSVRASFERGSFGIELSTVQSIWGSLGGLLSSSDVVTAKTLLEVLGLLGGVYALFKDGLIGFIKWVRGRRITKVEPLQDGNVKIIIEDESTVISRTLLKLYQDVRVRKGLENSISKPLERNGVELFAARATPGTESVFVSKEEAHHFKFPVQEDVLLSEDIRTTNLQLKSIKFKEGNKWEFYDGASEYSASIADQNFLRKIDENQLAFAKNDILVAEVLERQYHTDKGLKTERTILKIKDHIPAARQIRLPFGDTKE
ncbi:hypothetical protein dsat_1747 [Alkalidesulfovibrio alkalitolerans DSM 16529]|uniref:Uncharacterized protein n=1 Tax=Alkalidesulfovibrio alkalitolerans DSM 16529 TaxID=1121439 RepID=S7UQA1_9BACT|nr:hypothetical protein [Alkalidesulfovibrio alkalitolerans]EPR36219.1 hypothetical protein dsat_1747 [Alkalidesulfovibrio alkalitolerans DSM 16529]